MRSISKAVARIALSGVLLAFGTASAHAIPAYFDGIAGFGIGETAFNAAIADGVQQIFVDGIALPAGVDQIDDTADDLLDVPAAVVLDFTLAGGSPGATDRNTPHEILSMYTATEGIEPINDAWIVFLNPVNYTSDAVGLDLPNDGSWAVFAIDDLFMGSMETFFYAAVRAGDLGTNSFNVPNLVTAALLPAPDEPNMPGVDQFFAPQYAIGLVSAPSLPEPGTFALLGLAGALIALRRRA